MNQKITLKNNLQNNSLQIGDDVYYTTLGTNGYSNDYKSLGKVTEIGNDYIKVDNGDSDLKIDDFIMFSKNKKANNSSLLGYYAEIKLTNDSTSKAELFALSSEVIESSK
tara:strand:+ start:3153 stop:3482 length:330 start_codon:yes stop_codon:yes gene_type:complete